MPDLYDDRYADDVAGHVEAGAFFTDDVVRSIHGVEELFTGESIPGHAPRRVDNAGDESVNRAIGAATEKANSRDQPRKPVSTTAADWRTGQVTLANAAPVRLVTENTNRKDLVITNQSNAIIGIGKESGLQAGGPNVAIIAAGLSRTLTHTREVWVVGVAGQTVDFVETNY